VPAEKLHRVTGPADPMSVALTYVWAKGDPAAVERALGRSTLAPQYLTTAKQFLASADLATADRTYGFLRVIALAAALITMAALLLFLHARSRSQLVATAFLQRMGLKEDRQMLSVALEGAVLVGFSSLVGVGTALLTASSIASRVDPVPQYPPSTTATVPWLLLAAAFLIVLAAAALVGALASRVRGDVGEALRVA
jgi:predicted lysophospholipase L1 biosynthesis ABC-type transport system permease subunit